MIFNSSFFGRFLKGGAALAVIAACCAPQIARADAQEDFYFQFAKQRYFERLTTARNVGLGGAANVTATDSSSVAGNPAGIGMMGKAEFSGSYVRNEVTGRDYPFYDKVQQDIDAGHVRLALPLGPNLDDLPDWGNIGLGWTGYDSDVDDNLNTETDGTQLHFAYAKALNPHLSLGYSLDFIDDNFENDAVSNYEMTDGFRHNFGVQWWKDKSFGVGALFYFAYGDPNADIVGAGKNDYETEAFGFELGASWRWDRTLLAVSADYNDYDTEDSNSRFGFGPNGNEDGDDFSFRLGIEQTLVGDWLKGRIGYRYAGLQDYKIEATNGDIDGSAKHNVLALGLGADLGRYLRVDYGVEMRFVGDENDVLHAVTATVPFSLCREDWAAR